MWGSRGGYVWVWMPVPVCIEVRGQPHDILRIAVTSFEIVSHWPGAHQLGCPASKPQGLHVHALTQRPFTWVLGIKLWSSCLQDKHFIDWAISPVLTYIYTRHVVGLGCLLHLCVLLHMKG